jgi:hypothetical protein
MFCFVALANANTENMYTDLTISFPVHLFKNMQYIFVAYVYDLNAIIVRAMPTRLNTAMMTAFKEVIMVQQTRGYCLALNVMDNKCSTAVEQYIRLEKINIQLVPPHNHQANAAEWAIATFKEHNSLPPLPQSTSSAPSSFEMSVEYATFLMLQPQDISQTGSI